MGWREYIRGIYHVMNDDYAQRNWFNHTELLREWAEELLTGKRLSEDGILDPAIVGAAWRGLLADQPAADARIWSVLMFQAWRERWR